MHNYNTLKYVTDQQLIEVVKNVKSLSGVLKHFNLVAAGGNYDTLRKRLSHIQADTSHWTGQGWNIGIKFKNTEEYTTNKALRTHLIDERGHKCEKCGLSEWCWQPITLELDHIDGDRLNNENDNLKLLCSNCHSQTKSWRRRKTAISLQL